MYSNLIKKNLLNSLINTKHDRTRTILFSIFLIVFFYMLVFNLGYLPHFPFAQAQYDVCGDGDVTGSEDCDTKYTAANDPDDPCACDEICVACECTEITGLTGCFYYDGCYNGEKDYNPGVACDLDCGPDDFCDTGESPDCLNIYVSTCRDETAFCHEILEC